MRESPHRPLLAPTAWMALLSLIWGSSWAADQQMEGQGSPMALMALRYGIAAFVLYLVALFRWFNKRRLAEASSERLSPPCFGLENTPPTAATAARTKVPFYRLHFGLGVSIFAFPSVLLIWTGHLGAGVYTPLVYSAMPLILLIAQSELRATAIVAIGAMLVLLSGTVPLVPLRLVGALPALAAVLIQAGSLVYIRRHLPMAASAGGVGTQLASAACTLGAASLVFEAPQRLVPLTLWNAPSIVAITLLAILGTAIAYPLYYRLLDSLDPAQLTITAWLQTLVAVAEGALLLRQRPSPSMVTGAVGLVVCAIMLLTSNNPAEVR